MPDFEDMSPWAVHFAGPSASALDPNGEPSGYETVMSILYDGRVNPVAEPHGVAWEIPELAEVNRPACFSEVPLHLLDRLAESRSEYGVGFTQKFLRSKGGGRLWYVEDDSRLAAAIKALIAGHLDANFDLDAPLWKMTPFIDFATTKTVFGDYLWEREWRVPGGLQFEPSDVEFLFIPERFHDVARQFFANAEAGNSGPGYFCPYIDVGWDRQRITDRLAETPAKPEPSAEAVADQMGWFDLE